MLARCGGPLNQHPHLWAGQQLMSVSLDRQRGDSRSMLDVGTKNTGIHLAACASRESFLREDTDKERLEVEEVKGKQNNIYLLRDREGSFGF